MSRSPSPSPSGRSAGRLRQILTRPVPQTFVATVAISGFNVLTGVALARALGPLGRGELAAALLWPTLMRFLVMLGGMEAVTYRAARPGTRIGRLIGTAASLAAIQDAILAAAGLALLPLILSGYSDAALTAAFIYLGTLCIGTFGMYQLALFNGASMYALFNAFRTAVVGIGAIAIVALAVLDELTVQSAALCYLAGVAPTTVLGIRYLRRHFGSFERPDHELRRSLLSYGWRTQLSSTRNPLSDQLDQYAISIFLAPVELGLYAVAFTVTSVIGFFSASIATVALPSTAGAEEGSLQLGTARRYISTSFVISILVAIPIFVFAEPLIKTVFGDRFADAVPIARILLGATIMIALTKVVASVLNGLGKPGDAGLSGVISILGTGIGVAALIGPLGVEGAAVGTLLGFTASSAWCLWRAGQALSANPMSLLVPQRGRG